MIKKRRSASVPFSALATFFLFLDLHNSERVTENKRQRSYNAGWQVESYMRECSRCLREKKQNIYMRVMGEFVEWDKFEFRIGDYYEPADGFGEFRGVIRWVGG